MPVLSPHMRTESLEYHFIPVRIKGQKAYTVAPFPYAGRYGVISDLFSCFCPAHHYTLLPHSEQNFAPDGSRFPQFGQNTALDDIRAPQERQNFAPDGTDVPHFGHTA